MHRYLTRFFFLLLSLHSLPLAAAYDTYHLRLDDGDKYKPDSAQMVLYLAAREGAFTRMMLASGSTPTVAHTYFVAYAHPPANLQVPAVFREMAVSLSPEAITGSAVLTHTGNAGVARSVELNLSIAEDSIGGIVTVDGMEHAASGRVFRNADQRARQAFPSGAAWPRKMGPHDANVATAQSIRSPPHLDHGPVINGRSGGHSLNIAEGVLLTGHLDHGTTLVAFSADTGAPSVDAGGCPQRGFHPQSSSSMKDGNAFPPYTAPERVVSSILHSVFWTRRLARRFGSSPRQVP
ncbi:MAG: hypothetical protein JJT96_15315 [Opitutales bacterium]|nr:hypothetical protein [Opitutales bacterium]